MLNKKIILMFLTLWLIISASASAQKRDSLDVESSGGNALVILSASPAQGTSYTLSRSVGDSLNYKPVGTFRRAGSIAEFRRIAGDTLVKYLEKYKKITSDADLWKYIAANPEIKNYGLANLKLNFLKAMGCLVIDATIKGLPSGQQTYYKVNMPGKGAVVTAYRVNEMAITQKPLIVQVIPNDSVIYIRWAYPVKPKERVPFYAQVYKRSAKGIFEKQPEPVSASKLKDTLQFKFVQRVKPQQVYTYYIQPYDIFGNAAGQPSDTVTVTAADPNKMPSINNTMAKGVNDGILITWNKVVPTFYTSGIQIERSASLNGKYSIVATISYKDTAYLDNKVPQGKTIYYRLKAVGKINTHNNHNIYTGTASASYVDKRNIPDPPYNLRVANNTLKGVKLHWQPVANAAQIQYFVYRSNKYDTTGMQQISRIVNDTVFTDTAKNLSRRTNYSYAVKAVNAAGHKGRYSNMVQAMLMTGTDNPITPAYITASTQGSGVYLEWDNVKLNDNFDKGYILYRRKIKPGEMLNYDTKKKASAEALRLGFERVSPQVITHYYYLDSLNTGKGQCEYAVSAVDIYDGESGLSPLALAPVITEKLTAPVMLNAISLSNKIKLDWLHADAKNVSGYTIYRKVLGENDFKKLATVDAGKSTYIDNLVQLHKVYIYRIKAVNGSQESEGFVDNSCRLN